MKVQLYIYKLYLFIYSAAVYPGRGPELQSTNSQKSTEKSGKVRDRNQEIPTPTHAPVFRLRMRP